MTLRLDEPIVIEAQGSNYNGGSRSGLLSAPTSNHTIATEPASTSKWATTKKQAKEGGQTAIKAIQTRMKRVQPKQIRV